MNISNPDHKKRKAIKIDSLKKRNNLKEKLEDNHFAFNFSSLKSKRIHSMRRRSSLIGSRTKNYLWIVFFVKKFISVLRSNIWVSKLKKFKEFQYDLINDSSYFVVEPVNKKLLLNNPLIATMVNLC